MSPTIYDTRPWVSFLMTEALDFLMTEDDDYLILEESVFVEYTWRDIVNTVYNLRPII